jgi:predicted nucleotidyltransferase
MSQLSAEQMAVFRRTARARWQGEQQQRAARYQRARQFAHQAAQRLKEQFSVQRVVLFGSATQPERFNEWSDVDMSCVTSTHSTFARNEFLRDCLKSNHQDTKTRSFRCRFLVFLVSLCLCGYFSDGF